MTGPTNHSNWQTLNSGWTGPNGSRPASGPSELKMPEECQVEMKADSAKKIHKLLAAGEPAGIRMYRTYVMKSMQELQLI